MVRFINDLLTTRNRPAFGAERRTKDVPTGDQEHFREITASELRSSPPPPTRAHWVVCCGTGEQRQLLVSFKTRAVELSRRAAQRQLHQGKNRASLDYRLCYNNNSRLK